MSMTATVSRLSSFRYWRGNEAATVEDWLNEFNAPPNHRMDVGAAFNAVLESLAVGGEVANCTADGITFNFKCDAAIPPICPVYGRKEYGPVLVSGRAGIVEGKRVEVFKTTKKFDAERRLDDYQWRLLLDLFDADEFVWNIFVIAPNNPDETSYDVLDYHRLTAHRYPGLHEDCVALINDYHGIMSSIPEEDMFMASTGRGKAKALPREPEIFTIHGDIVQETEDAILVDCGADEPVWLPKSQIKYSGERGDTGVEIEIPELMADEKGFFDGMGRPESAVAAQVEASPAPAEPEQPETESSSITVSRAYAIEAGMMEAPEEDLAGADVPVSESAPEAPAGKRAFGDNVKWIKEEKITVSQPLSDAEKARYAEEMSALDKEIEALKDERAEVSSRLKKQIDAKEEERLAMSRNVDEGELRTFTCDCLKDYGTGEMVWTEAYPPYNEVQRRKMTKEEMQPSLLEYSEKMNASAPAEEGAEPAEPADAAPDGEGVDFDAMADADGAENKVPADAADAEIDAPGCTSCGHRDSGDNESCDGCGDERGNYTPLDQPAQQGAAATAGGAQ